MSKLFEYTVIKIIFKLFVIAVLFTTQIWLNKEILHLKCWLSRSRLNFSKLLCPSERHKTTTYSYKMTFGTARCMLVRKLKEAIVKNKYACSIRTSASIMKENLIMNMNRPKNVWWRSVNDDHIQSTRWHSTIRRRIFSLCILTEYILSCK